MNEIAVLCEPQGGIRRVLRLPDCAGEARAISDLVDPAEREKASAFVDAAWSTMALDWPIACRGASGTVLLHFAGIRCARPGLLVIAAPTASEVRRLSVEIAAAGDPEAAHAAEDLSRCLAEAVRVGRDDDQLMEAFTRLNNELANMQREMAKSNADLKRLNDEKNRFVGMAAHDLRNPLGVIATYSRLLLNDAGDRLDDEDVEMVREMESSSRFMLELIEDLLDVSKIEAGKLELDRRAMALRPLLERSVRLSRISAAKKDIRVAIEDADPALAVSVDAQKLAQVLGNLIGNAIKFAPKGTRVTVGVARRGNEVVVSVADQGPGIPAQEVETLFRPFQRSSVQPTGDEKSTGLGLSIAKRIVEGHGGRIWVESDVGRGSTFYFTILTVERAAEVEPTPPVASPAAVPPESSKH